MIKKISIVIPVYNEINTIQNTFESILSQTLQPNELIFVDSGSQDGTINIINENIHSTIYSFDIKLYININGYPGANRNLGIRKATHEWIVLLDAGITPENNWLEELIAYKDYRNCQAVFGICRFDAVKPLQKAFCAISHGCGNVRLFLASSLFHKTIFEKIGYFPENIRASEDLIWLNNFEIYFKEFIICRTTFVHYKHYPENLFSFINKYYIYELHSIKSGLIPRRVILINIIFTLFFLISFTLYPKFTTSLIILQFILRAIFTSIFRSLNYKWWHGSKFSFILTFPILMLRDLSKYYARLSSIKILYK